MKERNGSGLRQESESARNNSGLSPILQAMHFVCCFFILFSISGCGQNYTLRINNRGKDTVTIKQVSVNGELVFTRSMVLVPVGEQYAHVDPYATFKARQIDSILVTIEDTNGDVVTRECRVADENLAGCLIPIGLYENQPLTCACDSYADFD